MPADNDSRVSPAPRRQGVVAVCYQAGKFLVIRRSQLVAAPGAYCFPGGAIESGESEAEALIREMQEELGVRADPVRRLWSSTTDWGVELAWWRATLSPDAALQADPREVAAVHWMSESQMRRQPRLLSSNIAFLDAWTAGRFRIDDAD